jgi:topoisomerase-4 subunit A
MDEPFLETIPEDAAREAEVIKPVESRVRGMYREYFLEYASYVILERAVPALEDGLKPVQRRLMHALHEMEDGRFHKVANVIGQTMKYHPHGDASIGDALVQLGQKNLLIDTQGNWGNIYTGDSAAASRYIEARLSKFALDVAFAPKITQYLASYDGRSKEPVFLPVKFPLLLAQGVEGIAVGLSTKILPHNFVELIDASVAHLRGRSFQIYPDFPTGGIADVSAYLDGERGGRVRVRAKIEVEDKKTLIIREIPFGTTTTSLIESVIKANDKGKIKIKKIEDNTAEHVEIVIQLLPGVSPDQMVDALYAFTACESSVSTMACVIVDEKPVFMGVRDMLRRSTDSTVEVLKAELELKLNELQEQWHFASLEKIFIEQRIYRDIEEAETWEAVISSIRTGLAPHTAHLLRPVVDDDIVRLTEIRIKRISKFDAAKADDYILSLEGQIAAIRHHLDNLIDYAVEFFKNLKKKYGQGRERKTELRGFEQVVATQVAIANAKLYVNRVEGFVGTALRKDELVGDCADIDDVVVIRGDGTMLVTKVGDKKFVGTDIVHVSVFKKGDERTIYNIIYRDGARGAAYAKRFPISGVTRDKEYPLTQGTKGSEVLYFSVNPNGEAEVVTVHLRAVPSLKKLRFDFDFSSLAVRGRAARGNIVSKATIKKVELKSEGVSTLAAREIWFDETVLKLNNQGRGRSLGRFRGKDKLLEVDAKGNYRIVTSDLLLHFNEVPFYLERWDQKRALSAVYFDGIKERFMVKRFELEPRGDGWECFITEHAKSALHVLTAADRSTVAIRFSKVKGKERDDEQLVLEEFIAVKGWKALGNMLHAGPVLHVHLVSAECEEPEVEEAVVDEATEDVHGVAEGEGLAPGTTVEWSDLAQAPSINEGASEPEVDFGTEDDGQITLNF